MKFFAGRKMNLLFYKRNIIFFPNILLSPTKKEEVFRQLKYGFPFRVHLEHCRSFEIIMINRYFTFVKSIIQNISYLFYFRICPSSSSNIISSFVLCVKYDISYQCSRDRSLENIWKILCRLLTVQPHRVSSWRWKKINRPYHQFNLLGLRARLNKARWLIFNCATTFTVMLVMLFWAVGWLMVWERPKNVERGRRRSVLRYWDADKSLARPGRKQTRKHVRDARDFNNIETRSDIKFIFLARQGAEGNSRHSERNSSLFPSWSR